MTDVSAALTTLVKTGDEQALAAFYDKWKQDPLVMNQWLEIQSSSGEYCTVDKAAELMRHPVMDMKNPNKVRAVLRSFAEGNINFHAADGSGYRFFADQIVAYDRINKEVAAQLIDPLTKWHMYEEPRAGLMKGELQRIMDTPDISKNLQEKVGKSLAFQPREAEEDAPGASPKRAGGRE